MAIMSHSKPGLAIVQNNCPVPSPEHFSLCSMASANSKKQQRYKKLVSRSSNQRIKNISTMKYITSDLFATLFSDNMTQENGPERRQKTPALHQSVTKRKGNVVENGKLIRWKCQNFERICTILHHTPEEL
ncbi:predicted protein [Sclerotinia sclerotiorum 1980 UF-70]|uniref:Uncharacterized protein n=1 Tax=Sclerotinia sclerotiorum (strain ATCC 18683 / 1980 / Ss-1) TaxID=665079 RepID=A7EB76_SCLS1|nr:predicted protein [Sclerotinia sclerotiorum 1980 UF-70]EDN99704.1 predicted protein [Sclerotinia sclerotiorum 1980 UF-70]